LSHLLRKPRARVWAFLLHLAALPGYLTLGSIEQEVQVTVPCAYAFNFPYLLPTSVRSRQQSILSRTHQPEIKTSRAISPHHLHRNLPLARFPLPQFHRPILQTHAILVADVSGDSGSGSQLQVRGYRLVFQEFLAPWILFAPCRVLRVRQHPHQSKYQRNLHGVPPTEQLGNYATVFGPRLLPFATGTELP
jgi:hypothetical protein